MRVLFIAQAFKSKNYGSIPPRFVCVREKERNKERERDIESVCVR